MFPGAPSSEKPCRNQQSEASGFNKTQRQVCQANLMFQAERSCSGSWAARWAACRAAHSSGTSVTLLMSAARPWERQCM